jgi:hypothetical protein
MSAVTVGFVGDCRLFVGCWFSRQTPVIDRDKEKCQSVGCFFNVPFRPLFLGSL